MTPSLAVVGGQAAVKEETRVHESLAERVRRLQDEAKGLARQHVQALEAALAEVEAIAAEIAGGGDAYPPGVRDIARRLAEDCDQRAQTIEAIVGRTH
jgi:hypothetical protein